MAWTEALQCVAVQVQGPARLALLDPNVSPLDRGGHAPEVLRAAIAFVSASLNGLRWPVQLLSRPRWGHRWCTLGG
jgi:hypothetical protein